MSVADYTEAAYQKLNYGQRIPFSDLIDAFAYSSGDKIFATVDYRLAAVWEIGLLAREGFSDHDMASISNGLAYVIDQMPDRSHGQILRVSGTDNRDILEDYASSCSDATFAREIQESVVDLQSRGASQGFLTTVPEDAVIEQMRNEFEELNSQGLTEDEQIDPTELVNDHSIRGRSGKFAMRQRVFLVFMTDPHFGEKGVLTKTVDRIRAVANSESSDNRYRLRFKRHRDDFLGHVDGIERSLQAMGFSHERQTGQGLIDLVFSMLNPNRSFSQRAPRYSGRAPLREIMSTTDPDAIVAEGRLSSRMIMSSVEANDDGWKIDGHYYRVTSVKHMAERPSPHLIQNALSETEGSGWCCFNFMVRDQRKVRMAIRLRKGRQSSSEEHAGVNRGFFAGDAIKRQKNADDIAYLDNVTNPEEHTRSKVVDCAIHMCCRDSSEDKARRRARALESLLWESGYREDLRADAILHQTLPLNFRVRAMQMLRRSHGMLSSNMTDLVPLYGGFPGMKDGRLLMNNSDGTPIMMDPFTNMTPAPHQLVVGGTGSGKSFLVNALTMQMRSQYAPKTIIIDKGRSFEDLCESTDGQYVYLVAQEQPDGRKPICLNPLHINDVEGSTEARQATSEEIETMQDSIVAMCKSGTADEGGKTESVPKASVNLIQTVLIEIFATRQLGQELMLSNFAEALEERGEEGKQLVRRMTEFLKTGIYGEMFDGPLDVDWDNPMIVIETERFADRQAMDVVMLSILAQIDQYMKFRLPTEMRKMLIIDEAWRVLAQHARAVGQVYREARKYNCSITLISQKLSDFAKIVASEGEADDGISANTSHYYFLGSNPADRRGARDLLELEDEAERLWRNNLSVPPFYTEFLYVARTTASKNYFGAVRLYSNPVTLWLSSTHPLDRKARQERIDKKVAENIPPKEARRRAILELAQEYPYGSRYDYQLAG